MSKAHFHDLTQINVPFALLDDDTQDRLIMARKKGAVIQFVSSHGMWNQMVTPVWENPLTYRVSPDWTPPPIPPSVPWRLFKPELRFHARDEDGRAYLYTKKPFIFRGAWSSGDTLIRIDLMVGYDPGTVGWEDSLLERPEGV